MLGHDNWIAIEGADSASCLTPQPGAHELMGKKLWPKFQQPEKEAAQSAKFGKKQKMHFARLEKKPAFARAICSFVGVCWTNCIACDLQPTQGCCSTAVATSPDLS